MDCALGIDVGTAGSKAVLLGPHGQVLGTARTAHGFAVAGNGRMEQDPRSWWDSVVLAVRSVLLGTPNVRVSGVGVSGQMSGPVLLDRAGEPIGTCLIWADTRATDECTEITARIGRERIIALAGKPVVPAYAAPKLLWMRRHEPDRLRRAASLVLPKDYVRSRLTGRIATDPSDASNTLLFDITTRTWSEELAGAVDIPMRMLPDVIPSISGAGSLLRDPARALGLPSNTPVIAGAGDSITAAVANGLVPGGPVLTVIGSAGNVSAVAGSVTIDPQGRVHTGCGATDGSWIVTGVQQSAGLALEWLRRCLGEPPAGGVEYEDFVARAEAVAAGSDGLVFLPHLMGERSPTYRPHSRGAFVGLSISHHAGHLTRAVMEGVAYAQRESIDTLRDLGLPVNRLLLAGGGAGSPLWRSIQASVNRLPVAHRTSSQHAPDSSALGAAILAGVHIGFFSSFAAGADLVSGSEELDAPVEADAAAYQKGFRIYLELSRMLSPRYASWHRSVRRPGAGPVRSTSPARRDRLIAERERARKLE